MAVEPMRQNEISAEAYEALADALNSIFRYKGNLLRFIEGHARECPKILLGMDFGGYRRAVADEFVGRLVAGGAPYRHLAVGMMAEVSAMTSFPDLRWHADAEELLAAAKRTVAQLKAHVDRLGGLGEEVARSPSPLAHWRPGAGRNGIEHRLAELKNQFLILEAMDDRQKAGRIFEKFMNEIFWLFDLEPRLSYSLPFEQIDGAITFNTDDYIIEAKWWGGRIEASLLYSFDAKVMRKARNALGLFISVNGFTSGALKAFAERASFLAMDGDDIRYVLDGKIGLDDLLLHKRRYANETGSCYLSAAQITRS